MARATGAIIVEDDYDSEFRYDVGPLPALHSMDPDVIVYLGTASKMLAPALGAGWLVAGPARVRALAAAAPGARRVEDAEPVQHAVLALLGSGDLERHMRKMRPGVRPPARRRDPVRGADPRAARPAVPVRLSATPPACTWCCELPDRLAPGRWSDAAASSGVGAGTSSTGTSPGRASRTG